MKKLYLSKTDRKISGVCGGLAEYFSVDSALMRLLVVFVSLVTAIIPAIITYIVAAMILPHKGDTVVHDVK
jgi:phage shock protein C